MNLVHSYKHIKLVVYHGILAGVLVVSGCSPFVFARAKPEVLQGLVEEKPKFDVSLSNYTFNLGIKRTQLLRAQRRPILHAQDSMGLLHGDAHSHVFRLQTAAQGVSLQSQSAKTGRALQGQVDKNGHPLNGKVVENPRSPLNTIERFHAPFQLDLRKLTAEVAPDIVSQMDAEIGQARSKTADIVARQEKEMEPKLQGRTPREDMPPLPAKTNATLGLSRTVDSEIAASKQNEDGAARRAAKQLIAEMSQSGVMRGGMPRIPGMKVALMPMPQPPAASSQHSIPRTAVNQSEREMTAELARVNRQAPAASDLSAKLEGARSQARTNVAAAQPGLDAILTHSRCLPGTSFPAVPKVTAQGDASDVVPWDEWHVRFAQLARDPILMSVSKAKNPSGFDTVEITVWPDHRLDVKLAKKSNAIFDRAILDAYKSLSGNPGLQFPKRSRRQNITFLVDNEHKGAGVPSGVQSQTSPGDKEVIRYHL
jgi:hypothetical protein